MYAKFPIAIWKDNEGTYSVSTVSGTFACARGIDLKKCTEDLKKFIAWRLRNLRFSEPEFSEPTHESVEVFIRTEHETGQRRYPASEPIRFSLPYVWGELADSSICCCFPTIHASFYCYDEREMKQLVRSQAESHLMGCSPNSLINTLPPLAFHTSTINVKLPKPKNENEEIRFPSLESIATSLTNRANRKLFSRNWMREEQTRQLCDRLRASSGNIMLVGNKGVGKTTLLVNAARESVRLSRAKKLTEEDEYPDHRFDRFWLTSADRLVAGMQYLGQWEERAEVVIDELSEFQGVLCFESLEPLIRLGGRDAVDSIASFLIPYIQNQELRLVVEATPEELDASRRLLPNFESLFQIVKVEPMDNLQARNVLLNVAQQYQRDHKVGNEPEAAELCGQLFRRFLPYETFPGNCVRFWSSLFENASRNREPQVTRNNVVDQFIRKTGLPEQLIRDDFCLPADEIEGYFTGRVIGQDKACHSLTRVVTTFKAGLNDPKRPIGVQLFCGPTGVGKTELSKALADYLFGAGDAKDRLVRLDMSEYGGPLAAERLIMQSDGQPSEFIKKIREQPLVIVLLDEIEKASHEVFDVLMGMFDEGRLTDRWGRTTDFRSTVVIMTSNLGVRVSESLGFEKSDHDDFEAEVQKFFRPEFYNRIDRLIAFQPLSRDSISKIAKLELEKVRQREGLKKRKLSLEWSAEVLQLVTDRGYDAKYGARPLQRTIEQLIVAPLARLLAENPDLRNTKLTCEVRDNSVVLDLGS